MLLLVSNKECVCSLIHSVLVLVSCRPPNTCRLLGLAFHPNYESNGIFYINYSRESCGWGTSSPNTNDQTCTDPAGTADTVVARFSSSTPYTLADINSGVELLAVYQPYTNHNGGQIQFNSDPTDYNLYIGMGDGGSGGDPLNNGQSESTLLGKMLRYNVGSNGLDFVPAGSSNHPTFPSAIWAYGLRNPWRFSFDSITHDMYIADVGQSTREEVNFQPASSTGGENYGWKRCEGFTPYDGSDDCTQAGSFANYNPPIFDYVRNDPQTGAPYGRSVTGGYVYRGSDYPSINGTYFYADYVSKWIRGAFNTGSWDTTYTSVIETSSGVTSFGVDANGELYVGLFDGNVQRVNGPIPTSPPTPADSPPPTQTLTPSEDPTKFPTRAPFSVSVNCPDTYDQIRSLTTGLTLEYSIVLADVNSPYVGLFCARLVYEGAAWLGFGQSGCSPGEFESTCNKMYGDGGGQVVIGSDDGTTSTTTKYSLYQYGAEIMDAGAQTLIGASTVVSVTSETTTMEYAKFLSEDGRQFSADGQNLLLWAIGGTPLFINGNKHIKAGYFLLDLSPCPLAQCPGGQLCNPPPCTQCDTCNQQDDCANTNGCTWQQSGFVCSGNGRCSDCTNAQDCGNASCSWNTSKNKCTGGSQTAAGSVCSGSASPVSTCDTNSICGDSVCDAGAGETSCNCVIDCGAPPASETTCDDGVDEDCDGLVDCDDIDDCGSNAACSACIDPGSCTSGDDCCSGNCRKNGRCVRA